MLPSAFPSDSLTNSGAAGIEPAPPELFCSLDNG